MTFTALLLAGGESRRMGSDKALLEFDGQPLWTRQLQLLEALRPQKIFVSARSASAWLPGDVESLLDDPPSRGPLSGFAKALAVMQTTHLIALAVDMPFMTADEFGKLVEKATEGCGVVPIIEDRTEPLVAIYPVESTAEFLAALTGSDFSLQSIIRKLVVDRKVRLFSVPTAHGHFYRSVNEPGDVKL